MFLSKSVSKFSLSYIARLRFSSTQIHSFETLQSITDHIDTKQPQLYCIFFKAAWNPQCTAAENKFNEIATRYPGYEFYKFNTDLDTTAKRYYGVKYEPEFVICALGTEIARHYGLRLEGLEDKLDRVTKMLAETEFIGNTKRYEKFHERFMEEYTIYDKEFDAYTR